MLFLAPPYLCIAKPHLVGYWVARLRYPQYDRSSLQEMQVPPWAIYYLSRLPRQQAPPEAKDMEDWVRTLGFVVLIVPIALLVLVILVM